jgi:hypothetical protein
MVAAMFCVFDRRQLAHAPTLELHNGGWVPHDRLGENVCAFLSGF